MNNLAIELYLPERSKAYPMALPPDQIRMGLPIFFEFDEFGAAFYSVEKDGKKNPYYVCEIQHIEESIFKNEDPFFENGAWRLTLFAEAPEYLNDDYIYIIFEQVKDTLPYEVVAQAVRKATREISPRKLGLTSARRGSKAHTYLTVAQRLHLCDLLSSRSANVIIGTHQRNLVVYLLLTCFDRLGQPAPFLTFEQFLISKKPSHRQVREDALENNASADPITQALSLNRAYTGIYGVRNSFYRFMKEVLPRDNMDKLMNSIWLKRYSYIGGEEISLDETEKQKFLYNLRNSYTHQGESRPGVTTSLPTDPDDETPPEKTFYFYEDIKMETSTMWTAFSQWPQVLVDCVKAGLVVALLAETEHDAE